MILVRTSYSKVRMFIVHDNRILFRDVLSLSTIKRYPSYNA